MKIHVEFESWDEARKWAAEIAGTPATGTTVTVEPGPAGFKPEPEKKVKKAKPEPVAAAAPEPEPAVEEAPEPEAVATQQVTEPELRELAFRLRQAELDVQSVWKAFGFTKLKDCPEDKYDEVYAALKQMEDSNG